MCKWNKWGDTRIDPCMRTLVGNLREMIREPWKIVACCCGHGKYPMTIVVKSETTGTPIEIVCSKVLFRQKKFYKRDKQGHYYIPECVKSRKTETGVRNEKKDT